MKDINERIDMMLKYQKIEDYFKELINLLEKHHIFYESSYSEKKEERKKLIDKIQDEKTQDIEKDHLAYYNSIMTDHFYNFINLINDLYFLKKIAFLTSDKATTKNTYKTKKELNDFFKRKIFEFFKADRDFGCVESGALKALFRKEPPPDPECKEQKQEEDNLTEDDLFKHFVYLLKKNYFLDSVQRLVSRCFRDLEEFNKKNIKIMSDYNKCFYKKIDESQQNIYKLLKEDNEDEEILKEKEDEYDQDYKESEEFQLQCDSEALQEERRKV